MPIYPIETEFFVPLIFKLTESETEEESIQQMCLCIGAIAMTYKDKVKDLILSKISYVIQQLQVPQIQDYALRTVACLIHAYQLPALFPYFNATIKEVFQKHNYGSLKHISCSLEIALPVLHEMKEYKTSHIVIDCLKSYFNEEEQDLDF